MFPQRLAHALSNEHERAIDDLEQASGTPQFMAPEQATGRWRDYGPWTDLYALGCIAYQMVCARLPFIGRDALSVAFQHVHAPRPDLDPSFPIPEGVDAWIRRAMTVATAHRFRSAAEALAALPEATGPIKWDLAADTPWPMTTATNPTRKSRPQSSDAEIPFKTRVDAQTLHRWGAQGGEDDAYPTIRDHDTDPSMGAVKTPIAGPSVLARSGVTFPEPIEVPRLDLPESWEPARPDPRNDQLIGAGLGLLFGLSRALS